MAGLEVPPAKKFRTLGKGIVAGNGEIKVLYKDTANSEALISSYTVDVNFKCELK
jgi:hypothetical protein